MLVNIFLYDMWLPNCAPTTSPNRVDFIREILPQLQILKESPHQEPAKAPQPMETDATPEKGETSIGDIKLQVCE